MLSNQRLTTWTSHTLWILDSTYFPGDKLPKNDEFAKELKCASSTVQRAMKELSDDGLVERKRKGGTRVRSDPVKRTTLDIPITRREVEEKASAYGYQLINREIIQTPLSIAARFGLTLPQKMLRVEALHLADGRPYIYEDRWVSIQTVPEILEIDLSEYSANEWLVRNKPYTNINIQLHAERAGEYYSSLFDTDENEALFVIERTTWLESNPITSVKAVTMPGYRMISGTQFGIIS